MTVFKNRYSLWPLGHIAVPTPGTPVGIMSNVDASSVNAPGSPTPGTSGAAEYSPSFGKITIFPAHVGASTASLVANTGNIYLVEVGGSKSDSGSIIAVITPTSAPLELKPSYSDDMRFGPYSILLDADFANDGAIVTAQP